MGTVVFTKGLGHAKSQSPFRLYQSLDLCKNYYSYLNFVVVSHCSKFFFSTKESGNLKKYHFVSIPTILVLSGLQSKLFLKKICALKTLNHTNLTLWGIAFYASRLSLYHIGTFYLSPFQNTGRFASQCCCIELIDKN